MDKDKGDQLDSGNRVFSLEEILSEVRSSSWNREGEPSAPKKPPPAEAPAGQDPPERKVIPFPGGEGAPAEPEPAPKEPSKWQAALSRLREKAEDYAGHMFEEEEPDPEALRAEKLLPGVDEERPPAPKKLRLPQIRRAKSWPDIPPQELASRYGKGLGSLRVRRVLVFLLVLPLLYLVLAGPCALPLPGLLELHELQIWVCAGIQALAMLLSIDLLRDGLTHLGADTLTALAAGATLADACTMDLFGDRGGSFPYCLISVLALGFGLWGKYLKRLGLRISCRTAAAARAPYAVTLDEEKWDGRAAFTKWSGTMEGFGSQIQSDDGAMRVQRPMAVLLILASVLFSLLSSVRQEHKELFLWCLSATLCAAASFSGALAFSLPFCRQARRLASIGSVLAGWEGIRRQARGSGVLLTDHDLFTPGSVSLNGVKIFQDYPVDKVVSMAATLIRETGSGLDRPFHELLRSQGAIYRKASEVCFYEGGVTGVIRGDLVYVGNASFMRLMEIGLPAGLNVKNAIFCAIEGELAGIFALSYALHPTVQPALESLISNKIPPILATRDFNLIPSVLDRRFKLPADKMEFPEHSRRRALSDPQQIHRHPLVCILCRDGVGPLAETLVSAKRLCTAVRISSILAAIGSAAGVLLAYYLTSNMAFGSLSVLNLLVFLLMWLVPTLLISGWVNRY